MSTEVRVPDIGDFHDIPVIEVLVKPGDTVKKETPLITLESEKASMEVPSTDYIRLYSDSIRPYITDRRYVTLGTDGYGRSDLRKRLRSFFEVNRYYVAIAALHALAQDGTIDMKRVSEAIAKYGIDPKKPNPVSV